MVTDFGQILTEVLPIHDKLSAFSCKRMESYLQWRVKGSAKPENLTEEEEKYAQEIYNEVMVRYIVRYSNFSDEDVFRTGFSQLLAYPEFSDPIALTTGLSLFENSDHMRLLLNDCVRDGGLRYWIGKDLAPYASAAQGCFCHRDSLPFRSGPCRRCRDPRSLSHALSEAICNGDPFLPLHLAITDEKSC